MWRWNGSTWSVLRREAFVGMKWFRSHIKQGARLALLALVVQFALSFGHFHAVAQAAAEPQSSRQQLPAPDRDSDRHPADACAICAVMSLAHSALLAAPPALPLPQAVGPECPTTNVAFLDLNSARGAFQPRAPPLP
jgi:hypothetical protein